SCSTKGYFGRVLARRVRGLIAEPRRTAGRFATKAKDSAGPPQNDRSTASGNFKSDAVKEFVFGRSQFAGRAVYSSDDRPARSSCCSASTGSLKACAKVDPNVARRIFAFGR